MAHIGVSVSDGTKEKWEEFIEGSDHGSMSELVRTAVRKEIQREGQSSNEVPRELQKDLTQVAETQSTLESQMQELLDGFEDVEEIATEDTYPEEIKALGHRIGEQLEEIPEDVFGEMRGEVRDEFISLGRTVSDTEETVPYSPGEIEQALQYLEENLSYIESVPKSPEDYYRIDYRNRGER